MSAASKVDLHGLMGMLSVSDDSKEKTGRDGTRSDQRQTSSSADGWSGNSAGPQRKSGQDRSEEYREKGNELYKLGAFEAALDYYTRSINADPRNEKAIGNRCAVNTVMKRFREALSDAEYGIGLNPRWGKLYSRKAVAHFYLKQFDECVASYTKALELEPGNAEYAEALTQAKAKGGSVENLRRKAEAERKKREQGTVRSQSAGISDDNGAVRRNLAAIKAAKMQEMYKKDMLNYQRVRRDSVSKWRESTGRSGEKPEEDRGRSVNVDLFGFLRGRCTKCECTAWDRDVDKVQNAWGNMEAIQCSLCGHSNQDHESCGQFPMTEPVKPKAGGWQGEEQDIPGIHRAK